MHEVWGFGNNENGQLGLASRSVVYDPTKIYSGSVSDLAVGAEHSLLALTDGRLLSCGSSKLFQSGHFEQEFSFTQVESFKGKAKRVAAGKAHSLVLDETGRVHSFGNGSKGQLGFETETDRLKPKVVDPLSEIPMKDIACGPHSSFAITEDGQLYAWGCDLFFQLGSGKGENTHVPVLVTGGLEGKKVKKILSGLLNSAAITEDGEVFVWGSNKNGSLGFPIETRIVPFPTKLELTHLKRGERISDMEMGWHHSIVSTETGRLICWGDNTLGQLGIARESVTRTGPMLLSRNVQHDSEDDDSGQIILGCGNFYSLFATGSGDLYVFGSGSEHQLGLGIYHEEPDSDIKGDRLSSKQKAYIRDGTILHAPHKLKSWSDMMSERAKSKNERVRVRQILGGNRHTLVLVEIESNEE